jgi:hypothetical protein
MIYLSNFSTAAKDTRAVSIATLPPKWYKGVCRKDLAPKVSTLRDMKSGNKSNLEYTLEYLEIIYSLDIEKLSKELDEHILLCFCSKKDFCHRFILGSMLKTETGIEVEELNGFDDRWKDDFENNVKPVNLILTKEEKSLYGLDGKFENDDIIGHWSELNEIGATELFIDKIRIAGKENINPNYLNMKGFVWDTKKLRWAKICHW